jgi:hypothetical protein
VLSSAARRPRTSFEASFTSLCGGGHLKDALRKGVRKRSDAKQVVFRISNRLIGVQRS